MFHLRRCKTAREEAHEGHAMDLGAEPRQDVGPPRQLIPLMLPPESLELLDRLRSHLEWHNPV